MAIKINHATETLTPETGVLEVDATGAIKLPAGIEEERPAPSEGLLRYSKDLTNPEFHDGTTWRLLTHKDYVDNLVSTGNSDLADTISNLQLNDLTDVTVTNPIGGEVLVYDTAFGQFRSQTNTITPITRNFQGDGTTLEFDIETSVSSPNLLVVSINGITQEPYYSYTVIDGTTLTFDEAPAVADRIQVRILRSNTTSDRPRPKIIDISYSTIGIYTTVSIVAHDITYGTGVKIGDKNITRIDYPAENILQVMVQSTQVGGPIWETPQDLTLIDTSGNEYVYKNLINYGAGKPQFLDSTTYIGRFRGGDSISFDLSINNATSITLGPAYAGETALSWLSISLNQTRIVGTAPNNSSPSRYEFTVTASNGVVDITKNYWLLVI
jgi:Putative Ig domain